MFKKLNFALSPESAYLFLALLFGLPLVFITPPWGPPDEPFHFSRTYQIAEGRLIAEYSKSCVGGTLPAVLEYPVLAGTAAEKFKTVMAERPIDPKTAPRKFQCNAGLYSPVPYLPQALGVAIARPFLGVYGLLFLTRLITFLCVTALVWWSLRLLPSHKWGVAFLFLSPMSLYIHSQITADCITNAIALLLLAASFHYAARFKKPDFRGISSLYFLSMLLALSKNVFILLPAAASVLLWDRFRTRKQWLLFTLGLGAVVLLTTLGWSKAISGLYISPRPGTDPAIQLADFISNPMHFFDALLFDTLGMPSHRRFVYRSFIGVFGWLAVWLPLWFYDLYLGATILIWNLGDEAREKLSGLKRWGLFLITIGSCLGMYLAFYFFWTPVGNKEVEGIQGRYLIPIAPYFWMAISGAFVHSTVNRFVQWSALGVLATGVWLTYSRLL